MQEGADEARWLRELVRGLRADLDIPVTWDEDAWGWTGFLPRKDRRTETNARAALLMKTLGIAWEKPRPEDDSCSWIADRLKQDQPVIVRWHLRTVDPDAPGKGDHLGVVEEWDPGSHVLLADSLGDKVGSFATKRRHGWERFLAGWRPNQIVAVVSV